MTKDMCPQAVRHRGNSSLPSLPQAAQFRMCMHFKRPTFPPTWCTVQPRLEVVGSLRVRHEQFGGRQPLLNVPHPAGHGIMQQEAASAMQQRMLAGTPAGGLQRQRTGSYTSMGKMQVEHCT